MSYKEVPQGSVLQYLKENFEGRLVENSRSQAGNWLQFTLMKIDKGNATLQLKVKHEMTNPYGNIHGGMMSLVMDEAIGWAVISLDMPGHYTSLNLNVDFLFAIKEGETLIAKSEVLRAGKKIINVECHIYDENGRILARGNSNLIATNMELLS